MVVLLTMALSLVACSDKKANAKEEEYFADEDFMKDLAKGLETRWSFDSEHDDKTQDIASYSKEHKEYYEKLVDSELDSISKYMDEKFKDSKLKESAVSYINALNEQKEAAKYIVASPQQYEKDWEAARVKRAKLLESFVRDYGLTVSDEYQDILDEFMITSQTAKEEDQLKEQFAQMTENLQFAVNDDGYGNKTCTAEVHNITDKNFKQLQFQVNLLDGNNTIVQSTYGHVNNINADQKAVLEFMTNKDFVGTDVTIDFWEEAE
jgi:hypothetical protein